MSAPRDFGAPAEPDPFAGPPVGTGTSPDVLPAAPPAPGYSAPASEYDETTTYSSAADFDTVAAPVTDPYVPNLGDQHDQADDGSASQKANDTAQAGKEKAGEVASTAADKAKDVAGEAKAQAANVVGNARDQLRQQAGDQHRKVVDNLHSLADELKAMAERSDQSGPATQLVSEAGTRAKSAASWMDDRDPEQLLDEVRAFARRRPGAFVLGAVVAGVAAGRLTRGVVDEHRDDSGSADGPSQASA